MKLKIQTSQVVGLSDDIHWSQTVTTGNFIMALELISDGTFSAKEEGNQFLTKLGELLKKRQPQGKDAFKLLVGQFLAGSLIQNHLVSLIVGMYLNNQIYIFCQKRGRVLIKRGDSWSELIKGSGFIFGNLKNQDVVIFETDTFQKLLSAETVIDRFTHEKDPQRAGEKLGALLHNFDNSKGAAAVFAFFEEETVLPVEDSKTSQTKTEELPPIYDEEKENQVDISLEKIVPSKQALNNLPEKVSPKEVGKESFFTNYYKKIKEKLSFFRRDRQPEETTITYPSKSYAAILSSPKKRILIIILGLSLILLGSIFIGMEKQGKKTKTGEISTLIGEMSHKVEEGEGLIGLNDLHAKTVLREAEKTLLPLQDKFKKGTKERIQIEDLLRRVQAGLSSVNRIYKEENVPIFLDLTVIKANAQALNFALYKDKLAILDIKNNSVISVNLNNLASSIVGGGEKTPQPKLIAVHGNNIFILSSNGLVKIDTSSKTQEVIVKNLSEIANPVDMVGYGGNVYLLDLGNRKIWKFMALTTGYSEAKPYLPVEESIRLENPVSLAINGSVWVLGNNQIKKYTKGVEEPISLEGLDTPLSNTTVIFTDDESKFIYLLDKGENRVVVFDKEGKYNSQYIWSGITSVSDIVVSEKLKKILLLSGSIIYAIDLK